MIIKASDFKFRNDLENRVRGLVSLTPDPKPDYEIHGSKSDLAKLQLSDTKIFWGINCYIVDKKGEKLVPVIKTQEKINRGDKARGKITKRKKKL